MASKMLRNLLHELRLASPNNCIKNSLAARYILAQFKKYQTTDQQLCKARDEVMYLGNAYWTYLSSQRRQLKLHKEFHGSGEKSVRQTADMVGFKLPTDPK